MPTSQNGYAAGNESLLATFTIPGTTRKVRLRKGSPGELLVAWAAWFDAHIETIDHDKQLDDWGYAFRPIRGQSSGLSNHASGTAIDLNATQHPRGVKHTFTPGQVSRIDKALAEEFGGVIRWGEHYQHSPVDGMHFELNAGPAQVFGVLEQLRNAKPTPPAKQPPPRNHVTEGRRLIREGIAELRKTPESRRAIHNRADEYAAVYKKGPSK